MKPTQQTKRPEGLILTVGLFAAVIMWVAVAVITTGALEPFGFSPVMGVEAFGHWWAS